MPTPAGPSIAASTTTQRADPEGTGGLPTPRRTKNPRTSGRAKLSKGGMRRASPLRPQAVMTKPVEGLACIQRARGPDCFAVGSMT
eukprot:1818373-Alexandrium_andersonii.AAC.1